VSGSKNWHLGRAAIHTKKALLPDMNEWYDMVTLIQNLFKILIITFPIVQNKEKCSGVPCKRR